MCLDVCRAEVCRDLDAAVHAFALEGCWAWKPLLDGREVGGPFSDDNIMAAPCRCLTRPPFLAASIGLASVSNQVSPGSPLPYLLQR